MNTYRRLLMSLAAGIALAGCASAPPADTEVEEVSFQRDAVTQTNGTTLNGTTLNGTTLNGTTLNGTTLNGTTLNGTDFIGAEMSGTLDDGSKITLRINDIDVAPNPTSFQWFNPNADILLYDISYCAKQSCTKVLIGSRYTTKCTCASWQPLCGTEEDGTVVRAIPFKGKWSLAGTNPGGIADGTRETHISFACRDSSMAKCAEKLHYKPWKSIMVPNPNDTDPDDGIDMVALHLGGSEAQDYKDDFHQACVRMLRADYCGDGVAHTKNGTPIDVWDGAGLNEESQATWRDEAEWNTDGAKCLSDARWNDPFTDSDVGGIFVANAVCPDIATCPDMATYLQKTCPSKVSDIVSDTLYPCFSAASMVPYGFFSQTKAVIANSSSVL